MVDLVLDDDEEAIPFRVEEDVAPFVDVTFGPLMADVDWLNDPSMMASKSRGVGGARVLHMSDMESRFKMSVLNTYVCQVGKSNESRRETTHLVKSHFGSFT